MNIGINLPRIDGTDKLSGKAAYVDDLQVPGLWHGGTIRSRVPRGRIRRILFDSAVNWNEFVVVDHRDIPGQNTIALIEDDQPALASKEIRHLHEPVILLAHSSIHKLREALQAVTIDVEPLPAVFNPEDPLTPELIQHGTDNVFKRIDIHKGDPAGAFAQAKHVVEGTYRTGPQEHVYLETQGIVAQPDEDENQLIIRGSMQCPYYVLDALQKLFDKPTNAFRVIQTPIGGAFGGKEDYPSMIAAHAALLADKVGRPVKIIYDRREDMLATTKRHPSRVRHRTALDNDGRLLAMEIDVLLDGGAYVTLSPVVLSRGVIHAAGPYRCQHVHIHGEAKLTNSPPYGAFRGFGAPQTIFALERHMDVIADQIGIAPDELRRRNLLTQGETLATGQVFRDKVDLRALMDKTLALALYNQRRKEHEKFNQSHPYLRRGIGLAAFHHGSGFTGSGEVWLASQVWVEGLPDGTVEILTAQTDMGQGTTTILTQIAADALGIPEKLIRVANPDTSRVPNSGPTVASRTAMVVGNLLTTACHDLIRQVNHQIPERSDGVNQSCDRQGADNEPQASACADAPFDNDFNQLSHGLPERESCRAGNLPADQNYDEEHSLQNAIRSWHQNARNKTAGEKRLIGRAEYQKPKDINWDEVNYRGDAYAGYSWSTHVAEVEVDLRTYAMRVTDFVAGQEVGKVINPTLAEGQIKGGVVQGIGWALYEDVILKDGAMANAQMTNYIIPATADLPPIRVHFEESPSIHGPKGAKGIGELPMDGPAPAVINAVCNAVKTSINALPLTPERLMESLWEQHPSLGSEPRAKCNPDLSGTRPDSSALAHDHDSAKGRAAKHE